MWKAENWFEMSVVFACVVIPFWDIIPIGYILYIHNKVFKSME